MSDLFAVKHKETGREARATLAQLEVLGDCWENLGRYIELAPTLIQQKINDTLNAPEGCVHFERIVGEGEGRDFAICNISQVDILREAGMLKKVIGKKFFIEEEDAPEHDDPLRNSEVELGQLLASMDPDDDSQWNITGLASMSFIKETFPQATRDIVNSTYPGHSRELLKEIN